MARLYSDENFPLPVVLDLRRRGHDVLTVFEAGNANQRIPDDQVLAFAIAAGRAVLTVNRKDFVRFHIQSTAHAGIVVCTFDTDFAGMARRIDLAISGQAALAGNLLRVTRS